MNVYTKKSRRGVFYLRLLSTIFLIVLLLGGLFYLNASFKVKNINIDLYGNNPQNPEIKVYTENIIRQNAGSLYRYMTLDDEEITKIAHNEYPIISTVKISKSVNLNLKVVVSENEQFFYTCVPEELGFLAKCMLGNTSGEFYDEMDTLNESLMSIEINPKVLYDAYTKVKVESPDSLSGTRIYTSEDFSVLREVIKWAQKNGFEIKKVYVDELKIVSIYTNEYTFKISLDKGYVDTIKDFELISRTGNLQKYINEEKNKIEYIDLSYKNKVFYRLKGAVGTTTTSFVSTSTPATTTATSTQQ